MRPNTLPAPLGTTRPNVFLKQCIVELKTQLSQIEAQLSKLDEPQSTVALHPATLQRYTETVDALSKTLADTTQLPPMTVARSPKTFGALFIVSQYTPSLHAKASRSRSKASLPPLLAGRHSPAHGILASSYNAAIAYDSGYEVVAGDRYIATPAIKEAFLCYRRHAP